MLSSTGLFSWYDTFQVEILITKTPLKWDHNYLINHFIRLFSLRVSSQWFSLQVLPSQLEFPRNIFHKNFGFYPWPGNILLLILSDFAELFDVPSFSNLPTWLWTATCESVKKFHYFFIALRSFFRCKNATLFRREKSFAFLEGYNCLFLSLIFGWMDLRIKERSSIITTAFARSWIPAAFLNLIPPSLSSSCSTLVLKKMTVVLFLKQKI